MSHVVSLATTNVHAAQELLEGVAVEAVRRLADLPQARDFQDWTVASVGPHVPKS